jgi:Undecaprenyl-phosphate glucose phosphotransferase
MAKNNHELLRAALTKDVSLAESDPEIGASGKPRMRFTSNVAGSLALLMDVVCFLLSVPIALLGFQLLRQVAVDASVHIFAFALTLGSFLLLRSSRHAYRRSMLDPLEGLNEAGFDAIISGLIASSLIWQAGLIDNFSRALTLLFLTTLVVALSISRPLLRKLTQSLARKGQIEQRIVFYGADQQMIAHMQRLIETLDSDHLKIVGIADERVGRSADEAPAVMGLSKLCELARRGEVDQVIINGGRLSRERVREIVEALSGVCVDVSLVPREAIELSPDYSVNLLGNVPVLTLWQRPFRDANYLLKRAEDLTISLLALVVLAPIMLFSALLIRFTSPGPVLFIQPRVGFNNEVIKVFKFRTMYAHQADMVGNQTTTRNDPRVTPAGRVLRKFSLDELPQLLNVLQGNMSIVGPRPHATKMKVGDRYYHEAVGGYAGRHRVKPGITGFAQVKGLRGEVRTVERAKKRVELDKYYIENWSIWLDLWILMATARAVLSDRDAY